jgi:hypothetical protein
MSGPLCDAVLARSGSGQMLASLERSNLLLATLDRHRGWYRYHHLFHEPLQAELERREPELVEGLHARAAAWCEANGLPELAVDHAQAAGDADRVARLVATLAQPAYAAGRVETVRRWLAWFVDRNLVERYPAVAVLGTYLQALVGLPAAAERWAAAAERARADGKLPDGSTVESWIALARARLCRDGVDQMRPLLTYGLCFLAVQALLELGRAYLALTIGPGSGRPSGRPVTSSSSDPISATCPPRSRTFSRPWSGPVAAAAFPRSPPPSCACSRSCPPTCRSTRSPTGCTCHGTRSRPMRSPSTASSGCPHAAKRSSVRRRSAYSEPRKASCLGVSGRPRSG